MQNRAKILSVIALIHLSLLLVGCGSKSGSVGSVNSGNSFVTRADSGSFSTDARVLAARESTDGRIPAAIAKQVDNDLAVIRAHTPAVSEIHARPTDDPDSLLVDISASAPWFSAWDSGRTTTGVPALDTLGTTYRVNGVRRVALFDTHSVYLLTFADPLAMTYIAAAYRNADPGVLNAYSNSLIGDGDNIVRRLSGDTRIYALSRGWGDCPAGCTRRHTWTFTLTPDGGISVAESGTPLP